MTPELPLAAAQRRRARPGRPRNARSEEPANGHDLGIAPPQPRVKTKGNGRALVRQASAPLPARLLDLHAAAAYLGGLSPWTIRDLVAAGRLPRVRLPLAGDRECRRLLFDVRDIDRLIEASKE